MLFKRKEVTNDKPVKDLSDIKGKFVRVCTNAHSCRDKNGERTRYKRADLDAWSKEFYDKGESVFYTEPVDPKNVFGKLKICKPKYEWRLTGSLTEEEMRRLFAQ